MKYFVSGATGFIGGRLVRQLLAGGDQVVALARATWKANDLTNLGVTVHQGDITDKESLRAGMRGVDGVFHLAAWYQIGARDSSMAERVNVDGTRNMLELMKELAIPRGVYTSSLAVFSDTRGREVDETYRHDGPWLSEYDRTKWLAHYAVAEPMMRDGLPLRIVLPGIVYGPGDASPMSYLLNRYMQRRLPAVPRGTAFCWGYVDDVVRGHIQAMERGRNGESYIIAGPAHTLRQALEIAQRVTGIPVPTMRPFPWMMKAMAALMGVVGLVVPLTRSYRRESLRVIAGSTYLGSSEKARRELGFLPRSLEQGFRATLIPEMKRLGIQPPPGVAAAQ